MIKMTPTDIAAFLSKGGRYGRRSPGTPKLWGCSPSRGGLDEFSGQIWRFSPQ